MPLGGIGIPSVGTFTERTAEASTAVPYPATVPANSQLILCGSVFNVNLVTLPAGWTAVASFSSTGNTLTPDIFMARKTAAGTEGGTTQSVSHNNNVSAWQILAFPGVDTGTPLDVAVSTVDASTASNTTTIPGLTTVTPGCALVYAVADLNVAATMSPPTVPATFTETGDRSTGTRDFSVGYLLWSGVGATGDPAIVRTGGSGRSVGILIALRPALVRTRPVMPLQAIRDSYRW